MRADDGPFQVLLAQSGDLEALDKLFRGLQEPLFDRIHSIVAHREMAEDIVQDVFILLQRNLRRLREPKFLRAWALTIATREAYRRVAAERRYTNAAAGQDATELVDPTEFRPLRKVLASRLPDLVCDLPPRSRAVIALHYLDDLPISDVASILQIPLGTAKSRLAYGLVALRKKLGTQSQPTKQPSRGEEIA